MPNNRHNKQGYEQAKLQALELWLAGNTYRTIGATQNVTHAAAMNRVAAALDDMRPHADLDRYRTVQIAELDTARQPLRRIIINPESTVAELCTAIATLLKLQEREAKLLGLDRVPPPDDLAALSDEDLAEIVETWRQTPV